MSENLIEITSWVEKKDGSVKMTYNLTTEGEKVFKQLAKTKKKKFSPAFVNGQIRTAIKNAMKEDKK
jgi:DNA-binding PadR family transcriptional regulator